MSPPAPPSSGGDDDDEHSRRQEFCTGKGVPREPCAHPQTEIAGQTCSLALDLILRPGAGVDMAVFCISSARALVWRWDKSTGGEVEGKGKERRGEGR